MHLGRRGACIEHVFVSDASDPIDLIREGRARLAAEDRSTWSGAARSARLLELDSRISILLARLDCLFASGRLEIPLFLQQR